MKTMYYFLPIVCLALSACHHDDYDGNRRYAPTREYRRTDDSSRRDFRTQERSRRRTEQRRSDNMDSLPYLPPFTMRWDCPPEPQMLGYASR